MTNIVYQTAVEALEAILSPRVVSRSLKEGLQQVGSTPDAVGVEDLEKILKEQVYRQLQVTMPVTEAKETILGIVDSLRQLEKQIGSTAARSRRKTPHGAEEEVVNLREALKPFNLYFEWPEVQKLRAQVQLLDAEIDAGKGVANLLEDAKRQLSLVQQKLEDQLVVQARDLIELTATLEQVSSLGGAKVRRLESLVAHIEKAQESRQLAPAELERARKLGRDLRKLMESSVYAEQDPPPSVPAPAPAEAKEGLLDVETDGEDLLTIDTELLDPEVTARLLLLDVESERHDLDAVVKQHGNLLLYRQDLAAGIEELREQLEAGASVGNAIQDLLAELRKATEEKRVELERDIAGIEEDLRKLRPEANTAELEQALQVALGILATNLPALSDVQHIRNLHRLAREQSEEAQRLEREAEAAREARRNQQAEMLARLEQTLVRYEGQEVVTPEYDALAQEVTAIRAALADMTLTPERLVEAREAEERLEAAIARQAVEQIEQERATVWSLKAQLRTLPELPNLAEASRGLERQLDALLGRLDSETVGDEGITPLAERLEVLRSDAREHVQERLEALSDQAGRLGESELQAGIRTALDHLRQGTFDPLEELEEAVAAITKTRRAEQLTELRQLEEEAATLSGVDEQTEAALARAIGLAREAFDHGQLATNLDEGWQLLGNLRQRAAQRRSSFDDRLDAAMAAFEPAARLNSDDVTTVRRILSHLSGQRQAFDRISTRLQMELEASLSEAERLIEKLLKELEATQAIAGQLVSGNVLDDVLGFFGETVLEPPPELAPKPVKVPPSPGDTAEATGSDSELARWLDTLLEEQGIVGAAAFDREGAMIGGRLPGDQQAFGSALGDLRRHLDALGNELSLGRAQLLTLELEDRILISLQPNDRHHVAILLDSPSILSLILHKLRRDLVNLQRILGGPAFA